MQLRGLVDEDFVNFKKPSMFLIFPKCSFKCEKESGIKCCQNNTLMQEPIINIEPQQIIERYLNNNITESIICGGLEPFDSFNDLHLLIKTLRIDYKNSDPIVIYTGYNFNEITKQINILKPYNNIIIKFGRFIPNQESHYDNVLGVQLSSNNQFALVI